MQNTFKKNLFLRALYYSNFDALVFFMFESIYLCIYHRFKKIIYIDHDEN